MTDVSDMPLKPDIVKSKLNKKLSCRRETARAACH